MQPVSIFLAMISLHRLISCANISKENEEITTIPFYNDSPWAYEEKADEQERKIQKLPVKHKTNILDLSDNIIIEIGEYLIDPISTLSRLNKVLYSIFYKKFPVKYFVTQRVNIPEFESVAETEYELCGVLDLYWCKNDPFLLFGCLLEDLTSGKKRFKVLLQPLISYLVRIFNNNFDDEKISCFEDELYSLIECFWNDYNLISEILKINVPNLILYLIEIEDGKSVISFLRSNPDLASRFEEALIAEGNGILNFQVSRWLSDCIIYDAPAHLYIHLLRSTPNLLKSLSDYSYLFMSPDIPETEYPRIHSLLNDLFTRFLTNLDDDLPFLILLNDIRFGPIEQLQTDFHLLIKDNFSLVVQVALLENKTDILLQLYHQRRRYEYGFGDIMLNVIESIENLKNCKQLKGLKLIFHMILHGYKLFPSYVLISVVLKIYDFDHIDLENDKIIIEFRPNEKLSAFGFPLKFKFDLENSSVINSLIKNTKFLDENALISLISHQIIKPDTELFVNFKFFEFVTKSPNLIEKFIEAGIKLNFNLCFYDQSEEDFDFSIFDGNFSALVSRNIYLLPLFLTYFKDKNNFKFIEKFKGRSVADYFFDWQDERIRHGRQVTERDYFKWRQVFAYWIKIDQSQRERIKDIKFYVFINLLKLEFPEEMSQLLALTK